ncbi:cell wall-binding repeat-containing protein [Euzebya rosea]|uniref:cell wall-binding repeat-containing protein n=1 Tax=Euzebya rosea TaxID=2052804 RepID=UPI0013007D19|nr:cell wall-binding repeat-containing protein [Euzebya rosea]
MEAPSPSDAFRIEFEEDPDDWTSYEGELAFTNLIANNSDRVRVELMGRTHLGRDINLFVFGDPPPTPGEAREGSTVFLNCNVHGPEAGGREACFMIIRYLALEDDPFIDELLDAVTVIVMPSMNGDGRAAGSRGNARGQDLNRDHSLLREPEPLAVARAMSLYEPTIAIDGHHYGNNDVGDLPLLWARNAAVDEEVASYTQNALTLDYLFGAAEDDGWWPQPYPIGYSEETILRNTLGLKGIVGILLESRSSGGPTRPNASGSGGPTQQNHNDRRHVYSHLWTYRELLRFSLANHEDAAAVQDAAFEENSRNEGPLILHGTRDTPRISPPIRDSREGTIVDPAPCGYLITTEQYTERIEYEGDPQFGLMPSAQTRLEAHGIQVEEVDDGIFIPLGQPLRGLIALLFDPAAPGQQDDYSSYGSYQGPFLYSGSAVPLAECPAGPVDPGPVDPGPVDPTPTPAPTPTPEPTPTPTPTPEPEPFVQRLEGAGRVQTAIAVSRADFADGEASNIVLARADDYADALAGAPLAVDLHAPVLINPSDSLDGDVAAEIARALAPGGSVYLLGGESALGTTIEDTLATDGYAVVRLAGESRVETAIEIADVIGDPTELLITNGYDFPDAMTAGAAAGARGGAVLLTPAGVPHDAVDDYIADSGVPSSDVYAIGGPAATAYPDAVSVVGATRHATAVLVAETFFDDPMVVGFARDDAFPDALAGGPRLARLDAPLLLTASGDLSPDTADYLEATSSVTSAVLLGGESAISAIVQQAIEGLLNPVR